MRVVSWASLILLVSAGTAQAATNEPSGVMEVDLLYPRNETYAPTEIMPIVFGFQNPELAPLLGPSISLTMVDMHNISRSLDRRLYGWDFRWTNFSSSNDSTYYRYRAVIEPGLMTESTYLLKWSFNWYNCTEQVLPGAESASFQSNSSGSAVMFTTKSGAKKMDVESISESCPDKDQGFAFNVISTHQTVADNKWNGGETCAELASSIPVPDPCRNKVSPSAAASISAAMLSSLCQNPSGAPLVDCPQEGESGAARAIVGALVGLLAALGASIQLLA